MSPLVTRPLTPVPLIWLMSTPCSGARSCWTSGEERCLSASGCPLAPRLPRSQFPAPGFRLQAARLRLPAPGLQLPAARQRPPEPFISPGDEVAGPAEGRRRRRCRGGGANHRDDGVHGDRLAFLTLISVRRRRRRRNLRIHLVGRDLEQRLVAIDVSPTFLIHRTIVPSAIDSPIWGITTFGGHLNKWQQVADT